MELETLTQTIINALEDVKARDIKVFNTEELTDQFECVVSGGEVNLELRSPDSASNPYLVFALCLAAGMEGIEKGLQVPEELTKDIRKLNEEEKKLLGIQMLPENLGEAIKAMGQDTLVSKVLGETYRKGYMKAKRKEWKDYLEQVSEWELNRYLYRV